MTNSELFGGNELAVQGEVISAITFDSNIVIYAGPNREHEFRIENEIALENRVLGTSFPVRYDPYNATHPVRENLTEFCSIVATTVVHANAYKSGILELSLNDESVIVVRPKDMYEAWTYTFGSFILACPPGGFSA
jgi:hypothetical protein